MNFTGKSDLIKSVQKALNLEADGVDGSNTWNAIAKALAAPSEVANTGQIKSGLSDKALQLILDYEVGGGEKYYEKHLKRPTYPGGASGVTIGIGYDLGYNTSGQFQVDWKDLIPNDSFDRLKKCLSLTANNAKNRIAEVRDIEVSWIAALTVFKNNTIPRFIKETLKAFPEADQLHPDAFGALVSLVFNRGSAVTGESRKEMMAIRGLVLKKDYKSIGYEIRAMKRLWIGKGLDGLLARRDDEAKLVESCIS